MRNLASLQVDLSFLSKMNIAAEIESGYTVLLEKHKNQVKKTEILSKIIDCEKLCGKIELPLRGHDESTSSKEMAISLLPCHGLNKTLSFSY